MQFEALEAGMAVVFRDRTEPCIVQSVEYHGSPKQYGTVTVVAEAEVAGPRGGELLLELCESGRVRLRVGQRDYTPAYTVRNLERAE